MSLHLVVVTKLRSSARVASTPNPWVFHWICSPNYEFLGVEVASNRVRVVGYNKDNCASIILAWKFGICLSLVSVAMIKHWLNWLREERVYYIYRNQDRNLIKNLEAATEAETMEQHCSVPCFSWLAQPPTQSWHSLQWAGPSHINH